MNIEPWSDAISNKIFFMLLRVITISLVNKDYQHSLNYTKILWFINTIYFYWWLYDPFVQKMNCKKYVILMTV